MKLLFVFVVFFFWFDLFFFPLLSHESSVCFVVFFFAMNSFHLCPQKTKNWCNAQIVGRSQDDAYVPEAKRLPEAEPRAVYKDLKKQQVEFQILF